MNVIRNLNNMSFLNRSDEKFSHFLKKYWWIGALIIIKVIFALSNGLYGFQFAFIFLLAAFFILWALYRFGLE